MTLFAQWYVLYVPNTHACKLIFHKHYSNSILGMNADVLWHGWIEMLVFKEEVSGCFGTGVVMGSGQTSQTDVLHDGVPRITAGSLYQNNGILLHDAFWDVLYKCWIHVYFGILRCTQSCISNTHAEWNTTVMSVYDKHVYFTHNTHQTTH